MKRGENWDEKKENCKNCKREGGKLEIKVGMKVGKAIKRGEDLFFSFFFFFLLFTFENDGNLFWDYQKWKILYREKAFHVGKKIRKDDFAPSEKNMPVTPLIETSIFPGNLTWKLFCVTVVDTNIENLKSLHTFLNKYLYDMLMKFEQNRSLWSELVKQLKGIQWF